MLTLTPKLMIMFSFVLSVISLCMTIAMDSRDKDCMLGKKTGEQCMINQETLDLVLAIKVLMSLAVILFFIGIALACSGR